nr:MAG TPA: hypothetical protein [Caudoviricetes sp.]
MDIELLSWAVVGILGIVRVLSIGVCLTVLVVGVVISGVTWYLFQQKILLYIPQISLHGSRKWQLKNVT